MRASILIVTKNRKEDLKKTIDLVLPLLDAAKDEFLVFLDGCTDDSYLLQTEYPTISWFDSARSIGASKARNKLYAHAKGHLFIGLDDDAHPLKSDFIALTQRVFDENSKVGAITYQEIKGVFNDTKVIDAALSEPKNGFLCSEFIGCGFAVKKDVYEQTNGFPVWMDIYGEESCVSLEIMALGYDILYTNEIAVNHRVDLAVRKKQGRNHFRQRKQLTNVSLYYVVYYRNPLKKLAKLYAHNLKKYGLKDIKSFTNYVRSFVSFILALPTALRHRSPVPKAIITRKDTLPNPGF